MLCFQDEHKSRFEQLLQRVGISSASTREHLWVQLVNAYAEPQRHYHTAQHIIECLELFDAHVKDAPLNKHNEYAAELAIWWHDVVYAILLPPSALSNEELSASYAFSTLCRFGAHSYVSSTVHDFIIATDHKTEPTPLASWIVDIDMAILGADEDRFAQYEQQVEDEYTELVPHADYFKGRLQFLRTLLEGRWDIYKTTTFRDLYEERAHTNIQRLINTLVSKEAES